MVWLMGQTMGRMMVHRPAYGSSQRSSHGYHIIPWVVPWDAPWVQYPPMRSSMVPPMGFVDHAMGRPWIVSMNNLWEGWRPTYQPKRVVPWVLPWDIPWVVNHAMRRAMDRLMGTAMRHMAARRPVYDSPHGSFHEYNTIPQDNPCVLPRPIPWTVGRPMEKHTWDDPQDRWCPLGKPCDDPWVAAWRPVGRPTHCVGVGPTGRPMSRLIGHPVGRPMGRFMGYPMGRPIGHPMGQPHEASHGIAEIPQRSSLWDLLVPSSD